MIFLKRWCTGLALFLPGLATGKALASTQPVPAVCNATVNAGLVAFLHSNPADQEAHQDNVMVCGTMYRPSFAQHAGHSGTGSHEVLVVSVPTANGSILVEIVTNDSLDGKVRAQQGDPIFAYGQAYVDPRPIRAGGTTVVGGLHETHCSTHAGADDGWVVVAGKRFPAGSCGSAN